MLWFSKNHTAVWGTGGAKMSCLSVSTECASGTPRRPSVRYLVNSLLPIIHFQTSTRVVLHIILSTVVQKLNATLALSFGRTVWPVHRTVLRGAGESPACFWMSCCLPNAFSPQLCTSAAPPMGLHVCSQTQHVCSQTQSPPWIIVLPQLGIFTVREWCVIIRLIEQTVLLEQHRPPKVWL